MWMLHRRKLAIALSVILAAGAAAAQDVQELPGATRVTRTAETDVEGLVRRAANTVAFAVPGKTDSAIGQLLEHDFAFFREPSTTDKLHLRQVAPGVVEITSIAWEVGYWRFLVRDAASYYGLGERF